MASVDVETFMDQGLVAIRSAFSAADAARCREILWADLGCEPGQPATWARPVVRLGDYAQEPFLTAANAPALHAAFDTLVGPGRWTPRGSLGTCPVRFPSPDDPGDAGWHVDAGFYASDGSMRITLDSRGRALLMLFLLSDVGPRDAPTRILVGSHLDMPRLLRDAGEDGLSYLELAQRFEPATLARPQVLATGQAGDVFLCHPFLVHGAQRHQGCEPRFLAQPPLLPAEPIRLHRNDGAYSPVEMAIRRGLAESPPSAAHGRQA